MSVHLAITRGLPGSGKTTLALQWVHDDPANRARVNRDELRMALYGRYTGLTYQQEQAVTVAQQSAVEALLRGGKSVIVDDTNLKLRNARAWADLAVRVGVPLEVVDVTTDVRTCLAQDDARRQRCDRSVGAEVILDFAKRYPQPWPEVKPTPRKAGSDPEPYVPDTSKPKAWVLDIDGTIAKMNGRGPHDYHLVHTDLPIKPVLRLAELIWHAGDDIVVLSGRKDSCREQTEAWLRQNLNAYFVGPYMREAEDNRPDYIVKAELFAAHVAPHWNVQGCIDDRNQVVNLWRSMGLMCAQVAPGDF